MPQKASSSGESSELFVVALWCRKWDGGGASSSSFIKKIVSFKLLFCLLSRQICNTLIPILLNEENEWSSELPKNQKNRVSRGLVQ
jgi:hypothetical protein